MLPKLKPGYYDISVYSRARKYPIFSKKQFHSSCYLWIDGKRICKTKVGYYYWFHMVDGKIDHFHISASWHFKYDEPCTACIKTAIEMPIEEHEYKDVLSHLSKRTAVIKSIA